MDLQLARSHELKQAVTDFVLDAEGELAEALETYTANQSRRGSGENFQQDLIIDSFICEGKVNQSSPLELFIASNSQLSQSDRELITSWHYSFMGLFAITKILPDGFELRNWLTDKYYIAKPNNPQTQQQLNRCKEGEILLTRILPVTDTYWTFSSYPTLMGKLGKPKLAVAIGNFKNTYKNNLYSDAPELLEEAWHSVEIYHQQFIGFFGNDEVTMPGYQLNKKIAEFQEILTQQRLEALGIDTSKSLAEVAQAAGMGDEEIKAVAEELGTDAKEVSQALNNKSSGSKMVMPKVDLPAELRKAEQVTAISHPRWGQIFLPTYSKVKEILAADNWQSIEGSEKLIRQYLEDKNINAFIWYRLAQDYPTNLEKILQIVLPHPEFRLKADLDTVLVEFNKPLQPELPEIASVPVHLNDLFQEAVAEVDKPKSKGKGQKPTAKGFKR